MRTSFQSDWDEAAASAPVSDDWLEGLLAHKDEGPIGEPAARDLLREVMRLRSIQVPMISVCSLSGWAHVLRDEKRCEICDCEPVPMTSENVDKMFKWLETRGEKK